MSGGGVVLLVLAWLMVSGLVWVFVPSLAESDRRARRRDELSSSRRRERVRVNAEQGER